MALSLTLRCLDLPTSYMCIPRPSEEDLPKSLFRIMQSESSHLSQTLPDLFRSRVPIHSVEMFDAGDVLYIEDSHYWTKDLLPESPIPPRRICNITEYIDQHPRVPRQQRKLGAWPYTVAPNATVPDAQGNIYDKCVFTTFRTTRAYFPALGLGIHMVATVCIAPGMGPGLTEVSTLPNHFRGTLISLKA